MKPCKQRSRRFLSRWAGWFFAANIILLFLISLNYISFLPNISSAPLITTKGLWMAWLFVLLAFIGQLSLFAAGGLVLALAVIMIYPRRWAAFMISTTISMITAFLLIIDSAAYHLFHLHIVGVVWNILRSGVISQAIDLSSMEWMLVFGFIVVLLIIEWAIAFLIWRRLQRTKPRRWGRYVLVSLGACLFLSYTLYLSVGSFGRNLTKVQRSNDHLIVMEAEVIPYYEDFLSLIIPGSHSMQKLANINDGYFAQNKQIDKPLNYPLHPIVAKSVKHPYNIVIITIDTWRYDMQNAKLTPNIEKFSKRSWQFTDNYSGGNSTRPGIFSLFYSLPGNYWTAMLTQHQSPVFVEQLLRDHYQMGIFASASLHYPAFDDTVFRAVNNLKIDTQGSTPADRDRKITKEFKQFIDKRNRKKPFFSFLFYDAVHAYCSSGNYPRPYQPEVSECDRLVLTNNTNPVPYLNRYKNALHFDDGLVGQVLNQLKKQHLLKNTIVIITADHGEEFNDEKMGYWGHASAYDPYQIKTPLIIHWPHKKPRIIRYKTSHFDIVPTLMRKVLGVTNPISDYSVGQSLLHKGGRPYFIVGSYVDYAIVKNNRITTIFPGGNYEITYANDHPIPNAKLNLKTLKSVFLQLNRYFK